MIRRHFFQFVLGLSLAFLATTFGNNSFAQSESRLDTIPANKVLRVGWAAYEPYIFRDPKTNEVTGFSIDLIKEMAALLGKDVKVELVEDSWSTFAAGLQANKFDIFPGAAVSPQRALAIGFSEPYTKQLYSLLAPKDAVAKSKSWQDFDKSDQKIAVTLGSSTDTYLTRAITHAEILRVKAVPDGVLALLSGRVNAYASAVDSLESMQKEHPEAAIANGAFAISSFSFALPRNDQQWINWVNVFVREMKQTGVITKLLDKYGMSHSFAAD